MPLLERLRLWEINPTTTAADDRVDGVEAVRYTITEALKNRSREWEYKNTLWVSKRTKLPIRVVRLTVPRTVGRDGAVETFPGRRQTVPQFEWDPPLPAGFKDVDALFSLTLLPGYEVVERIVWE